VSPDITTTINFTTQTPMINVITNEFENSTGYLRILKVDKFFRVYK
jgi:hypothetical protein